MNHEATLKTVRLFGIDMHVVTQSHALDVILSWVEKRDGKPQYLRHIPRVWNYLQRSLAHPSLAPLNAW